MFLTSRVAARWGQALVTVVVFSLASGVVGGLLFYMGSSSYDVISTLAAESPVDMDITFSSTFYRQENITVQDVRDTVLSMDGVVAADVLTAVESTELDAFITLGLNATVLETFPDALDIPPGTPFPNESTCLLESDYFCNMGYEIGDNFTLTVMHWQPGVGIITVRRNYTVVGVFDSHIYNPQEEERQYTYLPVLRVVTSQAGLDSLASEVGHDRYEAPFHKIWVKFDRASVFHNSPAELAQSLQESARRVEQEFLPHVVVERFALLEAVMAYSSWSMSMTVIMATFSVPTVIMGLMLVKYDSTLVAEDERRDVGTVKTRGASRLQAFSWVLGDAVLVGFLGSLGAVMLGATAAWLAGGVRGLLNIDPSLLLGFRVLVSPMATVAVFVYSFAVGLVVALPRAVRAYLMSPAEAHSVIERESLLQEEQLGTPTLEVLAVAFSGYFLGVFMFYAALAMQQGFGAPVSFLAGASPLIVVFAVGTVHLLSRPAHRAKSWVFGKLARGHVAVGMQVLSRIASISRKSEARAVMFMAFVFTTGIFAPVVATTATVHTRDLVMFEHGADIVVSVNPLATNVTLDMVDNITSIDGVRVASGAFVTSGLVYYVEAATVGYEVFNRSITIVGVQPDLWAQSAYFRPYFTKELAPDSALHQLAADPSNVLTNFKPVERYVVRNGITTPVYGNRIRVGLVGPRWKNWSDCTVVDVMSQTEADYTPTYLPGYSGLGSFVVMDLSYVHRCLNTTRISKVYVALEDGANRTAVVESIRALSLTGFASVVCTLDLLDDFAARRTTQASLGTFTLDLIFTVGYLTFGTAIATAVKSRSTRRQMSVLRALGCDRQWLLVPAVVDVLVSLALGLLIGAFVSGVLASFTVVVPFLDTSHVTPLRWLRLPVLVEIPSLLLVAVLGTCVVVAVAACAGVTWRSLNRSIAQEVQYAE